MTTTVLTGHVLTRLAELPDESVHCVVCSPPYYGLRDYKIPPQIWLSPTQCCDHPHVWGAMGPAHHPGQVPDGKAVHDENAVGQTQGSGQFCTHQHRSPQRIRNGTGKSGLHAGRRSNKLADTVMLNPPTGTFCTHQHQWGDAIISHQHSGYMPNAPSNLAGSKQSTNHGTRARDLNQPTRGQFCGDCGAWRGHLGLEPTPDLYIAHLVQIFREVRRVLRHDGTLWVNIGDSYSAQGGNANAQTMNGRTDVHREAIPSRVPPNGLKPKDLLMIPARLAMTLQADGWWLRSEIVWAKRAPMPESVEDRPTQAHEKVFLLSKSADYFYDQEAVKEDGSENSHGGKPIEGGPKQMQLGQQRGGRMGIPSRRNMRNVWWLAPEPFAEAHFATYPSEIPRRAILAGTSVKGVCPQCTTPWQRVGQTEDWRPSCFCDAGDPVPATVLDPFLGSGTTALVADQLGRNVIGIELNPDYARMAAKRARNEWGFIFQPVVEMR